MIDHHVLTHPTWQFIMEHGDDELLKKRLQETYNKYILTSFDQFFKNNNLGTLAEDRREKIAHLMLDRLEFTVEEIQKEYNTKDEAFPVELDNMVICFCQIEESMQYLLRDNSVSYNANLMKRNNPLTVIEKLLDVTQRLSDDLDSACIDVNEDYKNAQEKLVNLTERLSKMMQENINLKEHRDNLIEEVNTLEGALDEQKQEHAETAKELEEKTEEAKEKDKELELKTTEAEEARKELSKRDDQFDEMKAFMCKYVTDQSESMKKIEDGNNLVLEELKVQKEVLQKQTEESQAIAIASKELQAQQKENAIELQAQKKENAIAFQKQADDLNKNIQNLKSDITASIEHDVKASMNVYASSTRKAVAKDVNTAVAKIEKNVLKQMEANSSKMIKDVSGKLAVLKREKNNEQFEVVSKQEEKCKKVNIVLLNNKNKSFKS